MTRLVAGLFAVGVSSVLAREAVVQRASANPIRRIVTLLQDMEKEVQAEMATEKDMYAKFECYCKHNDGKLSSAAVEARAEMEKQAAIEEQKTGEKKQLSEELKQHKKDRDAAKKVLATTVETEKERVAAYEKQHAEFLDTVSAIDKAVAALSKGMGRGAFLQTGEASALKELMMKPSISSMVKDEDTQRQVFSFLAKDYAPASGEIVGILKQMKSEINDNLGGAIEENEKAVKVYKEMKASKESEIAALSSMIEEKTELKGKVAVEIVQAAKAKEDAMNTLSDSESFLVKLKNMCGDKADEYKQRVKDAQGEVEAIQQAILVLNDDDALEVFKAADPKRSFLQTGKTSFLQTGKNDSRARAMALLSVKTTSATANLMASSIVSKLKMGVDFSKIITMIDEMVEVLKKDAAVDLETRDQCNVDLNENEQSTKDATRADKGYAERISELQGMIEKEIATMEKNAAAIEEAKSASAEATKQREKENAEYHEVVEMNTAAVQLIDKAINILNKYYNPAQYKKPAERELTDEEQIAQNEGMDIGETVIEKKIAGTSQTTTVFLQRSAQKARQDPSESAPEIFSGARKNKGQKNNSVTALMRMLQGDIKKDTQAVEHDEQVAERDYEQLMADNAKQVAQLQTGSANAKANKASYEAELEDTETKERVNEQLIEELSATNHELHASCDFILAHFEERAAARESEIDGLHTAKGVLAGASAPEF